MLWLQSREDVSVGRFQNMGQEIMLCTVRGLVEGRVKKAELKSFERWSSEDPTLAVRWLVCNPSSLEAGPGNLG